MQRTLLTPTGDLIAAFGSGAPGLTDGPAGTASFARPLSIAFAPDGSLIVVDDDHQTVRAIRQLRFR
jgi:hypothetical protein